MIEHILSNFLYCFFIFAGWLFLMFFVTKSFLGKNYLIATGMIFFILLPYLTVFGTRAFSNFVYYFIFSGWLLLLLRIIHILWNAYNTEERQLARQRERDNMNAIASIFCLLVGWNPYNDAVLINIFLLILAVCVIVVCTFC